MRWKIDISCRRWRVVQQRQRNDERFIGSQRHWEIYRLWNRTGGESFNRNFRQLIPASEVFQLHGEAVAVFSVRILILTFSNLYYTSAKESFCPRALFLKAAKISQKFKHHWIFCSISNLLWRIQISKQPWVTDYFPDLEVASLNSSFGKTWCDKNLMINGIINTI